MTLEAARGLVVGLCLLQLAAGAGLATGRPRLAVWGGVLCPLCVLVICAARIHLGGQWASLRGSEIGFLMANLASAGVGLVQWRRAAPRTGVAWGGWLLNTASCACMVYLAFFFRLF